MNNSNNMNFEYLPMGFGMALLQNPSAAMYYNSLSEAEKFQLIERTHSINSKSEMKAFIDNLGNNQIT